MSGEEMENPMSMQENFKDAAVDVPPTPELGERQLSSSSNRESVVQINENHLKNARARFGASVIFAPFSILSFILSFSEPILVSYPPNGIPPTGAPFALQIIVLLMSTILVCGGVYLVGLEFDKESYEKIKLPRCVTSCLRYMSGLISVDSERSEQILQKYLILINGDVLFELILILWGWCTIFEAPGIAALRCFRVFRLAWYKEIYGSEPEVNLTASVQSLTETEADNSVAQNPAHLYVGIRKLGETIASPFAPLLVVWRILQQEAGKMSFFLLKIEAELFWKNSKGSLVILAAYFYIAYIVSVVFWNKLGSMETPEGQTCDTLTHCYITLIRLSMYDGTGFDFLQTAMDNGHKGLVFLLFLYLVVTAIILLNGLIGIFGDAFSTDNDDSEERVRDELDSVLVLAGITSPAVAEDTSTSGGLSSPRAFRMASPRASPGGSPRGSSTHNVGSSVPDSSAMPGTIAGPEPKKKTFLQPAHDLLSRDSFRRDQAGRKKTNHSKFVGIYSACQFVFSKRRYFWLFFFSTSTIACIEPILVAFHPVGAAYVLQIVVLALSTALFFLSVALSLIEYDDAVQLLKRNHAVLSEKQQRQKELSSKEQLSHKILTKAIERHHENVETRAGSIWKYVAILPHMFSGEVVFELVVLIFGWATIIQDPGISALRCFRTVRMLWYVHVFSPKEDKQAVGFNYTRNQFELYASSTVKLCVHYLEKLVTDVPGKGALAVLLVYFYVTYVIMVVFWNQENALQDPEGTECSDAFDCYITLLRLCFYDGNGFDFLTATIDKAHPLLSTLLILYMCFSAMILLNGLIGIFGATFSTGVQIESGEEEYIDIDAAEDLVEIDMQQYATQYRREMENYLIELANASGVDLERKLADLRQRLGTCEADCGDRH